MGASGEEEIPYSLVHFSSTDPDYKSEEQDEELFNGKGWLSAKNCSYPQVCQRARPQPESRRQELLRPRSVAPTFLLDILMYHKTFDS